MKFIKNLESRRLVLPPALLAVSEIGQPREPPAPLEVHALKKTVVVLKGRMTALELLRRRKLHLLGSALRTNPKSLRCSSSPHETRFAGLSRGPR